MSFELVEMIKNMDFQDVGLQLGFQCAPLIAGIKASNLFILSSDLVPELTDLLAFTKFSYRLLYEGNGRAVFLVYDATSLYRYLRLPHIQRAFQRFGYANGTLSYILPIFRVKYAEYMKRKENFPHELGLLLAYPLEDVEGFICNKGKNFLHNGYWKVYSDQEQKMKLFEKYDEVRAEIVKLLYYSKMDILEVMDYYGKAVSMRKKRKQEIVA